MNWLRVALLAASIASALIYGWGFFAHFSRPDGVHSRMRAVAWLTALAMAAQIATIWTRRPLPDSTALALPLFVAALALFAWAVVTTRRDKLSLAFSADQPGLLIARGPYAWIRHPFYTAYTLYWLAGVVASLSWWAALAAAPVVVAYAMAARMEERKFLAGDLAEAYRRYRARTGMFIPWLRTPAL